MTRGPNLAVKENKNKLHEQVYNICDKILFIRKMEEIASQIKNEKLKTIITSEPKYTLIFK